MFFWSDKTSIYNLVAKPLIFKLPPEAAHTAAEKALGIPGFWNIFRAGNGSTNSELKTNLAGIELPTPIGMAAGFDKDCKILGSVLNLGFGFATGGTVTLGTRPGNPKPRIIRLPDQKAVINALGFPGQGLEPAVNRLAKAAKHKNRILVSISGTIEDEIVECLTRIQSHVSGVELNISSPNTLGLKVFHEPARLRGLIDDMTAIKQVPLFVKLPPWSRNDENKREILKLAATAVDAGVNGLVVANTHPIENSKLKVRRGGLSGAPLFEHTELMIADIQAQVQDNVSIIACGGVSSAEHVWKLLAIGASAVQLYTSFIYEGPGLPARINKRLIRLMKTAGISTLDAITGEPPRI